MFYQGYSDDLIPIVFMTISIIVSLHIMNESELNEKQSELTVVLRVFDFISGNDTLTTSNSSEINAIVVWYIDVILLRVSFWCLLCCNGLFL